MKRVAVYLLIFMMGLGYIFYCDVVKTLPSWIAQYQLCLHCILIGGTGGCLYCLRGIYLSACVRKSWDPIWIPWYLIRPITSCISGFISYIFMQAGILILDSKSTQNPSEFGYLAIAFIAGLNVDKFIDKIESLAKSLWGIEKSRSSSIGD